MTTASRYGTPMTPSQYADNWQRDSQVLAASGQYRWMAQRLGSQDMVLEIGCGTGVGTLELARNGGCKVVVVEENTECIARAHARLVEAGVVCSICAASSLGTVCFDGNEQVKLFNTDILDNAAISVIPRNMFSAVVCWLIGTYPDVLCKHLGITVSEIEQDDPTRYKLKILGQCFETGKVVLRARGKVHLVDRYALPAWNQKDVYRASVAAGIGDMAGCSYQISKDDVIFNRIDAGFGASSIQYVRPSADGAATVKVIGSVLATLL